MVRVGEVKRDLDLVLCNEVAWICVVVPVFGTNWVSMSHW